MQFKKTLRRLQIRASKDGLPQILRWVEQDGYYHPVWQVVGEGHRHPFEALIRMQDHILESYGAQPSSKMDYGSFWSIDKIRNTLDQADSQREAQPAIVQLAGLRRCVLTAYRSYLLSQVFKSVVAVVDAVYKSRNWKNSGKQADRLAIAKRLEDLQPALSNVLFERHRHWAFCIANCFDQVERDLFYKRMGRAHQRLEQAVQAAYEAITVLEMSPEEVGEYLESES